MVEIFAKLIIAKKRTLSDVPENLRERVDDKLAELGYDENGDVFNTVEEN